MEELSNKLLSQPQNVILKTDFNRITLVLKSKSEIQLCYCEFLFLSHRKYPLPVLSMPLKNLMESSLVPLFQKVKKGIHVNISGYSHVIQMLKNPSFLSLHMLVYTHFRKFHRHIGKLLFQRFVSNWLWLLFRYYFEKKHPNSRMLHKFVQIK